MLLNARGTVVIPRDKVSHLSRGTYYNHKGEKHYRVVAKVQGSSEIVELARYNTIEESQEELQRVIEWMSVGKTYKPKGGILSE